MDITAAQLNAYSGSITTQAERAAYFVQSAVRSFVAWSDEPLTVEALCENAAEVLERAVRLYGDNAAALAAQQYDETMAQLGYSVDSAEIYNDYTHEQAQARAYSALAEAGGSIAGMAAALSTTASSRVREAANVTTSTNASRDYSSGVRYARVPSGFETCGFCLMLASRGFVYESAESAGKDGLWNRYHDNCDCTVVASSAGSTVSGYDPDYYYSVYEDARQATTGDLGAYTATEEQTNAICREIERRTTSWAWHGKTTAPALSEAASGLAKKAATTLSRHGFAVSSPAARNSSLDLTMNGRLWSVQETQSTGGVASALEASRAARSASHTGKQSSGAAATVLCVDDELTAKTRAAWRNAVQSELAEGETALLIFNNDSLLRVTHGAQWD